MRGLPQPGFELLHVLIPFTVGLTTLDEIPLLPHDELESLSERPQECFG